MTTYGRHGVTFKLGRSGRVACSGRGRLVLDHIDTLERRSARSEKVFPLPISNYSYATLAGPFPIDPAEWDQMMHMLDTMKPMLVVGSDD